ncbi:unnamed protein product [Victoria cruziana]
MRNPVRLDSVGGSGSSSGKGGGGGGASKTTPCCSKEGLKRGPWTPEEDELLASYIKKEGEGRWRTLPKRAGLLRCGKSCRLRWMNYLRPSVKRGPIAPDEEDLILRLHRLLGNRWSLIAGRIPGRTDNEIKNYWNTHLSKKLISQGIDPRTHKPLPDAPTNPNPNPNSKSDAQLSTSLHTPIPTQLPFPPTHLPVPPNLVFFPSQSQIPPPPPPPPVPPPSSLPYAASLPHDHLHQHQNMHLQMSDDHFGTARGEMMMLMMGGGPSGDKSDDRGNSNELDEVDYSTDDIFSSFLNSLINEDVNVQQQTHGPLIAPLDDPLVYHAQDDDGGKQWSHGDQNHCQIPAPRDRDV